MKNVMKAALIIAFVFVSGTTIVHAADDLTEYNELTDELNDQIIEISGSRDNIPVSMDPEMPETDMQQTDLSEAGFTMTETGGNSIKDTKPSGLKTPKIESVKYCRDHELVKWKNAGSDISGIQIECSADKRFAEDVQMIEIYDPKSTSEKIDGLKRDEVYYVRIRTFRGTGDDRQYSKWNMKKFRFGPARFGIENNPKSMAEGRTVKLGIKYYSNELKGEKIKWTSSDNKIATVSSTGVVKAKHTGKVKISATCDTETASCIIKVNIKGVLTIIDDDGSKAFMSKLMPIVREKNVSISTAVVPIRIGKRKGSMTWEEINKCAEEGAEILCHTYKHHLSPETKAMTEKEIQAEYKKGRKIMEEHGYNGDIVVYSGMTGSIKKARKAASKVFRCGIHCAGNTVNTQDTDIYYLKRYKIIDDLKDNPDKVKAKIDMLRKNGGWMIWTLHSYNSKVNKKTLSNLRRMIDYSRKKGVDIVTAEEGYRRLTGR